MQGYFGGCIRQSKAPVVEALGEENDIGDSIVDGQDDHRGLNFLQDGSEDVEDIAEEPGDKEEQGEAIGRGAPEILDDLRAKYNNPAHD